MTDQKCEALYRADQDALTHRFGEDVAQTAFMKLLDAAVEGKPITRALLWRIAQNVATDGFRKTTSERELIERLGYSDSRIREQQSLYAHKVRDERGWNDGGEDEWS